MEMNYLESSGSPVNNLLTLQHHAEKPFGWNKAMNSRRIHLNTEAHSQSAIPLPSLQCCCLPLRKNERFQQVGPGLFIRCYYSQDIADGKHAQKLLFLAEHDKVVDTVLFH